MNTNIKPDGHLIKIKHFNSDDTVDIHIHNLGDYSINREMNLSHLKAVLFSNTICHIGGECHGDCYNCDEGDFNLWDYLADESKKS